MTQNQSIIELLMRGWTSPVDAFREVGTMKLATRVSEIRKSGVVVEERPVPYITRTGRKTVYKEYRIKAEAQ